MARSKNRKYYNLEMDNLLLISKLLYFLLINIGDFFYICCKCSSEVLCAIVLVKHFVREF
jgi:hypothetical protein